MTLHTDKHRALVELAEQINQSDTKVTAVLREAFAMWADANGHACPEPEPTEDTTIARLIELLNNATIRIEVGQD